MKYKLKEIFDLQMGKTPSRNNQSYWNTKDNKWISIADLTKTEKYISKTKEYLSESAVADSGIKIIPANTVVMSFKLSIGKTAITTEDMYSNEAIMSFHDKHVVDILPEYIYYLFKYKNWDGNSNKAVKGKTLNKATLSEVEIEICPIERQRKIVFFLDEIMAIIANKENELFLLDELVKARFVEMFGNEKNTQKLGDLVSICRGASPRPISSYTTKDEDGENWIKIGDVEENDIYINHAAEKVTKAGADKSRRVKVGDFILSNSMSFGRPYILNIDGCVHDGWLIISEYEKSFEQLFLYYLLRSDDVQAQFNGTVSGAVVKNLNSDKVRETKVIVPIKDKQKEFVEFSKQIDKSKFVIQQQIGETQKLFDKLMQEYFG